jgi:RHS repeat-associated protein
LYSGEQFDSKIGQQYLRARYYDPTTGRFNRLDPFFGNVNDPQSLHKYLYTHADPVNGIDPNGEFVVAGLAGFLVGFAVYKGLNAAKDSKDLATGGFLASKIHAFAQYSLFRTTVTLLSGIAGNLSTMALYEMIAALGFDFRPLWVNGSFPDGTKNIQKSILIDNVYEVLQNHVDKSALTPEQKAAAKIEAKNIAIAYVNGIQTFAKDRNLLSGTSDDTWYGITNRNPISAWMTNRGNSDTKCEQWANHTLASIPTGQYWEKMEHCNYTPFGDITLAEFMHTFVSVGLKGEDHAFVFDGWASGMPFVYRADVYFGYHKKGIIGWDTNQ